MLKRSNPHLSLRCNRYLLHLRCKVNPSAASRWMRILFMIFYCTTGSISVRTKNSQIQMSLRTRISNGNYGSIFLNFIHRNVYSIIPSVSLSEVWYPELSELEKNRLHVCAVVSICTSSELLLVKHTCTYVWNYSGHFPNPLWFHLWRCCVPRGATWEVHTPMHVASRLLNMSKDPSKIRLSASCVKS